MESDICALLMIRLREQKSDIELFLATGGAKNWDEYCRMVGSYSALLKMEGEIQDAEQRMLES